MLKKYYSVFGPALRILDASILIASWFIAYYLRKYFPLSIMRSELPPLHEYGAYSIVIVLLWGTVFSISNLYTSQRMTRRTIEAYKVIRTHFLSLLIFIALTYLVTAYKLSRGVFIYFGFLSGFLLVACRLSLRNNLRRLRARGYNLQRVLIVGTGLAAKEAYHKLTKHPELGLQVLGYIGNNTTAIEGTPVLGSVEKISEMIKKHKVHKLVIALSRAEGPLLERTLNSIKDEIVDVILVPDIYDYIALGCEVEDFDGLPMVSLNETPIMGVHFFLKRATDICLASFALFLFFPIMVLIAVWIKLFSKGPIFYSQERMSLNGKRFKMHKFRTMSVDQMGDVEVLTKKDDPRISPIGHLLRSISLDELPQFLNVLKGDMSIVGPRPERTWVVEKLRNQIPRYMLKHKVKAGITGWAQVNGWRGDTSLEKRIEYDLYYIKHWSMVFDMKILFLTLFKGFINRNAY